MNSSPLFTYLGSIPYNYRLHISILLSSFLGNLLATDVSIYSLVTYLTIFQNYYNDCSSFHNLLLARRPSVHTNLVHFAYTERISFWRHIFHEPWLFSNLSSSLSLSRGLQGGRVHHRKCCESGHPAQVVCDAERSVQIGRDKRESFEPCKALAGHVKAPRGWNALLFFFSSIRKTLIKTKR